MIPYLWILALALPYFVGPCGDWPHVVTIGNHDLGGRLSREDYFGHAVASPGDIDGDGVPDLLVGAPFDDVAGPNRGAVWLLHLGRRGEVRSADRFAGSTVEDGDLFGRALAVLDDPRGDRLPRVAVGACRRVVWGAYGRGFLARLDDFPREPHAGVPPAPGSDAVRILEFDVDHRLREVSHIGLGRGGFNGMLDVDNEFGYGLASLGDLDGDGVADLAVGAPGDDGPRQADGSSAGFNGGAVWILFLTAEGAVARAEKVGMRAGGFAAELAVGDHFGSSMARLGDLDGDGTVELAVGAMVDDTAGINVGAVWIVSLGRDGRAVAQHRITPRWPIAAAAHFGSSLAALGDRNADGHVELLVGASRAGRYRSGRAWILTLDSRGRMVGHDEVAPPVPLRSNEQFGRAACRMPDLDGDGIPDFALGIPGHESDLRRWLSLGKQDEGAAWLYLGYGR